MEEVYPQELDMTPRPLRRLICLALAAGLLAACAGAPGREGPAPGRPQTSSPPSSPPPSAGPRTSSPGSVFVLIMENRSYAQAMSGTYTAGLASRFAVATEYHAVAHPSLPNYLALTSGSTQGITDDGFHALSSAGLGGELSAHQVSWGAYMESMTEGCYDSPAPYALKHNPFAYYRGGCPANVTSLSALAGQLRSGTAPRLVWITPNLCHDGHDCSTAVADAFLSQLIPTILASSAWRQGGLLLITWDEAEGDTTNRVPCLVVAPHLLAQSSSRPYNHYSLLATVSSYLGVPALGQAALATPFTDLVPNL
ncbi:MAG TPA: alkaline phosphatase family protein [Candidatus Nitrosotalea sp.]|nr:alkaline phosphatase family protein [Candidatus Nitrosotalea sp.]